MIGRFDTSVDQVVNVASVPADSDKALRRRVLQQIEDRLIHLTPRVRLQGGNTTIVELLDAEGHTKSVGVSKHNFEDGDETFDLNRGYGLALIRALAAL